MPIHIATTAWRHEPSRFLNKNMPLSDANKQKEFERVAKIPKGETLIQTAQQAISTKTTSALRERPKGVTGIVYVNQLPLLDPGTSIPDEDTYKYYPTPTDYTPANGKYGWYVYKTITHGLNLSEKSAYILELIDLHLIDEVDLDTGQIIQYTSRFDYQRGIFEHEGLDTNMLIIRGIFKPDLTYYLGTMYPQELEYVDEPNQIIRTNLIFRYTITKVD